MNDIKSDTQQISQWFAIKTAQDFKAEAFLADKCDEIFFPKELVKSANDKNGRVKAVIPHVLFVKTSSENILNLEKLGRMHPEQTIPFWIYRYPKDQTIQVISPRSIDLLRLLTFDDTTLCKIYTGHEFKEKELVRVTGGIYKGYEGFVQRVQKNKHVVVKIEGVSMVILPFIHPDLLQPINNNKL